MTRHLAVCVCVIVPTRHFPADTTAGIVLGVLVAAGVLRYHGIRIVAKDDSEREELHVVAQGGDDRESHPADTSAEVRLLMVSSASASSAV
jgi:hypothetical protein